MDFGDVIFFIVFAIIIISNIVKQLKKAGGQPSENEPPGNQPDRQSDRQASQRPGKKSGWKNVLEEMLEQARKQMEEQQQPEPAGKPPGHSTGWEDIAPAEKPRKKASEKRPGISGSERPRQKSLMREGALRQRTTFKPNCMRCEASMKGITDLGVENQQGLIYCDNCGEQHQYQIVSGELNLKRADAGRQAAVAPERRYEKTAPAPGRRMPDNVSGIRPMDTAAKTGGTDVKRKLSRDELQNAVVWSEILGKPLGLRDLET